MSRIEGTATFGLLLCSPAGAGIWTSKLPVIIVPNLVSQHLMKTWSGLKLITFLSCDCFNSYCLIFCLDSWLIFQSWIQVFSPQSSPIFLRSPAHDSWLAPPDPPPPPLLCLGPGFPPFYLVILLSWLFIFNLSQVGAYFLGAPIPTCDHILPVSLPSLISELALLFPHFLGVTLALIITCALSHENGFVWKGSHRWIRTLQPDVQV